MTLDTILWTEKYRPKSINDYVFVDERQRTTFTEWIEKKIFPNLLLSGSPGVGKGSAVSMLLSELSVHPYDVLTINASRENGIDVIRDKITNFVSTIPFGDFKVVFLDEADFLSPNAMAALRNDMESYSSTVRFILCCNLIDKVMPALRSRCTEFHITKLDRTEFTTRVATILLTEEVEFELDILDKHIDATYPDMRKCISEIQVASQSKKLLPPDSNIDREDKDLADIADLIKKKKLMDARKKLLAYIDLYPTRVEAIYKWMYDNLDLWGKTDEHKDAAIIIIRNGLAQLPLVGIAEIAVIATIIELTNI